MVDFSYFSEANVFKLIWILFLHWPRIYWKDWKKQAKEELGEVTTSPPEVTKLAVKSAMTQNVDILLILPKGNSKLENVKELLPTTTQFKGGISSIGWNGKIYDRAERNLDGTSKTSSSYMVLATICKVCEKKWHIMDIKRHIESIHLEGISVPCIQCSQAFKSRDALPCFKTSQTELMQ